MTKRILFLIPTLDRSGAEKQLALLASGLPRDRFEPEVVCLTRGGPFEADLRDAGIPVRIIGKRSKFSWGALRRLRSIIRDRQPDILHTWLFAANAYGRLAVGRRPSVPVIVSERCVDSWKSKWQLWLDRRLVNRTARMIGNSEAVAQFYQELGFPADRLSVIHNGVTIPPAPLRTRAEIRAELDVPEDSLVVGYVGRLAPQKRIKDIVAAYELLSCHEYESRLVVIGDGPDRQLAEEFAKKLGCNQGIRWLGHREDASELMSAFDQFWLTSEFEGQSNSLMEAMSRGLACIVSDIAANRELVADAAITTPVNDAGELAKQANLLWRDPSRREELSKTAKMRVQTEFSVEKMINDHCQVYESVLEHSAATKSV